MLKWLVSGGFVWLRLWGPGLSRRQQWGSDYLSLIQHQNLPFPAHCKHHVSSDVSLSVDKLEDSCTIRNVQQEGDNLTLVKISTGLDIQAGEGRSLSFTTPVHVNAIFILQINNRLITLLTFMNDILMTMSIHTLFPHYSLLFLWCSYIYITDNTQKHV